MLCLAEDHDQTRQVYAVYNDNDNNNYNTTTTTDNNTHLLKDSLTI